MERKTDINTEYLLETYDGSCKRIKFRAGCPVAGYKIQIKLFHGYVNL